MQVEFALFFFFQAEDGIRDYKVTGVQTCALPIYVAGRAALVAEEQEDHRAVGQQAVQLEDAPEYLGQPERLHDVARLHERGAVGGVLQELPLVNVHLEVGGGHRLEPVGVQVGEELADRWCGLVGHRRRLLSLLLPSMSIYKVEYYGGDGVHQGSAATERAAHRCARSQTGAWRLRRACDHARYTYLAGGL